MADHPETLRAATAATPVHVSEPPSRETLRGIIAMGLLGMVFLEFGFMATSIVFHWMTFDEMTKFAALVITPTIGFVGPIVAFFFKH